MKKIRLKTLAMLIDQYGIAYMRNGHIRLKNYGAYNIIEDMYPLFDGKEYNVEVYEDDEDDVLEGWISIMFLVNYHTWKIHKDWIDNSMVMDYTNLDNLFKEPI